MSDFCLSCCSTADLSPEWMKKRDLRYVCFRFTLDGEEYLDDMGVSMPSEELFRRMSPRSVWRDFINRAGRSALGRRGAF